MMRALILVLCLVGCAAAAGCGATYGTAVDERNVGTVYNDEKITFIIKKRFLEDDKIKYLDFDAACYEGRVILVGEYESRVQIDRAVSLARSVPGVRTVTDYFLPKIQGDICGTTDNLTLLAKTKKLLINDDQIWSTNVDVKVVQCHIILMGIVGSQNELARAEAHARSVPGSRGVKSFLRVKR